MGRFFRNKWQFLLLGKRSRAHFVLAWMEAKGVPASLTSRLGAEGGPAAWAVLKGIVTGDAP